MHVEQILARKGSDVVTVSPDTTVGEAARLMTERRIGAVLVRGETGVIAGILSERDIVRGMAEAGGDCARQPVASLMTAEVAFCDPADTIDELMEIMTERRFRHLPVMADNRLVGMISIGDVVKHRIGEIQSEAEAMRAYIVNG
ncbi:MAG: CBS domain-containing protein [Alphaproteobacteria bacterium]